MDDLTEYLEGIDFAEPDAADAMVRAFAERLAHLIVAQGRAPHRDLEPALIETFATIIEKYTHFDSSIDPTILSWFYRQAIPHLPVPADRRLRRQMALGLSALLAAAPHHLTEPEIANALNLREPVVARRIRDGQAVTGASIASQDRTLDIQAVSAGVLKRLVEAGRERKPGPSRVRLAWKEGVLALIAAGAVLALVFLFMRSDQSERGVDLFTERADLPEPITVDSPKVRVAGSGRSAEDVYLTSLYPALSDDGRYLLFTSNRPDLVEGDGNENYDLFVTETATGEIHRVSLGTDGTGLPGQSFAGAISSDGSRVVFITELQSFGVIVYVADWQTGQVRAISGVPDLRGYPAFVAPGISGDGNTIFYWGVSPDPDRDACGAGDFSQSCYDLYVYEYSSGNTTRIPIGKAYIDVFQTTSVTFDGSLIALTVNEQDAVWFRLGSPNQVEATLYDWRLDRFILLNAAPDGTFGNGNSTNPVVSADGMKAAFISTADNLVAGEDEADSFDLFYSDRETGTLKRIRPAPIAGAPSLNPGESALFMGIDISPDGRYVIFADIFLVVETNDRNSIYCGMLFSGWQCLVSLIYDAVEDTIQQLPVEPILAKLPEIQLLYLPSISQDAENIAFQVGSWEVQPPCPVEGCMSVWLLQPDLDSAVLASRPAPVASGPAAQQRWTLSGSLPGPSGWVNAVAFAPSGRWLASGRADGSIQIADLAGAEAAYILGTLPKDISSLAFSPNGQRLAAGSHDGSVTVWNLETRTLETTLSDHPGIVLDVAFSPDGKSIAVGTQQALWIWTDSPAGFYQSSGFIQEEVHSAAFSPGGTYLAAVSENEIWIRSIATGAVIARLAAHADEVLDLAFSPSIDGSYLLATASRDDTVQIWRLNTTMAPEHVVTLAHPDWVSAVAFSPDGALLATGSFDGTIYLWETETFDLVASLHRSAQDQILSLAFDPAGELLAGGTVQSLRIWQSDESDFSLPQTSRFFRVTGSEIYEPAAVYLENWFRGTDFELETFGDIRSARASVEFVFNTLEPVPDPMTLQSVGVYRSPGGETIGVAQVYTFTSYFGPARLTLLQASRLYRPSVDFRQADWPVVPSAAIIEHEVGGYSAEIVLGGWGYEESGGDGNSVTRRWTADASSLFIRWQDDDWYYSVYFDQPYNMGLIINTDLRLDLNGLIDLIETDWMR